MNRFAEGLATATATHLNGLDLRSKTKWTKSLTKWFDVQSRSLKSLRLHTWTTWTKTLIDHKTTGRTSPTCTYA